ncbi:MAG TPA: hypothetical protein VGQ84_13935 [Gaiellaceae bacterium]|nr:hypothetical protein [Gaiellaceae bacterium]
MAYACAKGAIVVAAAGNGGVTTPFFPAAAASASPAHPAARAMPSSRRSSARRSRAGRAFGRTVGTGKLRATVRFGGTRLTLRLFDARDRLIARAAGRSPLRLMRTLEAGSYRLEVSRSGRRASFALDVAHASAR